MKNFYLPLALLPLAFAAYPTFVPGDTINWVVDLREAHPIGIVCPALRVQQIDQYGRFLADIIRKPSADSKKYFSDKYFLGNRYCVNVPAESLDTADGGSFSSRLTCLLEKDNVEVDWPSLYRLTKHMFLINICVKCVVLVHLETMNILTMSNTIKKLEIEISNNE